MWNEWNECVDVCGESHVIYNKEVILNNGNDSLSIFTFENVREAKKYLCNFSIYEKNKRMKKWNGIVCFLR